MARFSFRGLRPFRSDRSGGYFDLRGIGRRQCGQWNIPAYEITLRLELGTVKIYLQMGGELVEASGTFHRNPMGCTVGGTEGCRGENRRVKFLVIPQLGKIKTNRPACTMITQADRFTQPV